jgi:hypothetical protein
MLPTDPDHDSISIKRQAEDLGIILLLLVTAVITGFVIATVQVGGLILAVLWILELATIIAAVNKTLPLLVTTVKHLHDFALAALESIDDLQSRMERRKIRIVLEDYSRVIEIPVTLQKQEIEEVQKTLQLLIEVLELAKTERERPHDNTSK